MYISCIYIYIYQIYTHTYIYIYVYMCIYLLVYQSGLGLWNLRPVQAQESHQKRALVLRDVVLGVNASQRGHKTGSCFSVKRIVLLQHLLQEHLLLKRQVHDGSRAPICDLPTHPCVKLSSSCISSAFRRTGTAHIEHHRGFDSHRVSTACADCQATHPTCSRRKHHLCQHTWQPGCGRSMTAWS